MALLLVGIFGSIGLSWGMYKLIMETTTEQDIENCEQGRSHYDKNLLRENILYDFTSGKIDEDVRDQLLARVDALHYN